MAYVFSFDLHGLYIFRRVYKCYDENLFLGGIMPYDQESFEAGINIGFALGVVTSCAVAGAIWIGKNTIKWVKKQEEK
jgi:hypothetical protein